MGIVALIGTALSAFIEFSKDFKSFVAMYQQYQAAKWKQDLQAIVDHLNQPTSTADKADLAKKLADLIAS